MLSTADYFSVLCIGSLFDEFRFAEPLLALAG
jgi:hypothetical protein